MILSYKLFESELNPKIDDIVVCMGDINDLNTNNHIGILRKSGIEFLNRFSDRLHDLNGEIKNNNGWYINNTIFVDVFDDNMSSNKIPVFYSDKFKNIIIHNMILNFLLDYERIYYSDVSFIDITERNNTISCLSRNNYNKLENKKDVWTTPMRQNMSIGRFIKKIIPNEIDEFIENYTNEYKFSYNLNKNNMEFKVYRGLDMAKWYLESFYATGGGSLHSSCMKHIKSQRRLALYTDSPNKVKMLAIKNPEGELLGRALLWKLDEPKGEIYMDRIYSVESYIDKLFIDYAKKKGFLTYENKDDIFMRVNMRRDFGPPSHNPFMDTFKFFVKNGYYLTNKFRNFGPGDYYEYIDHD